VAEEECRRMARIVFGGLLDGPRMYLKQRLLAAGFEDDVMKGFRKTF
jgi:hypothetical protein